MTEQSVSRMAAPTPQPPPSHSASLRGQVCEGGGAILPPLLAGDPGPGGCMAGGGAGGEVLTRSVHSRRPGAGDRPARLHRAGDAHRLRPRPDGVALRVFGPLLRIPASRFARLMAHTDAIIGQSTVNTGSQWLLSQLVTGVTVRGAEAIPMTGPLIIVSNHPGAYDSVSILASLPPRTDQMIVASDIPFLRRLPAIGAHTIYVSPDPHARMGVIRAMIRHLEAGGAVMTFGSGLVDPDPDLLPGAAEALETWYDSLAIVLRRVPETRLVLSIVSSVVAPQYMRSPLTRLKGDGWDGASSPSFCRSARSSCFRERRRLPHAFRSAGRSGPLTFLRNRVSRSRCVRSSSGPRRCWRST